MAKLKDAALAFARQLAERRRGRARRVVCRQASHQRQTSVAYTSWASEMVQIGVPILNHCTNHEIAALSSSVTLASKFSSVGTQHLGL